MSNTKTVAGITYNLDNYGEETHKQSIINLIEITRKLINHGIFMKIENGFIIFYCENTKEELRTTIDGFFTATVDDQVKGIIRILRNE